MCKAFSAEQKNPSNKKKELRKSKQVFRNATKNDWIRKHFKSIKMMSSPKSVNSPLGLNFSNNSPFTKVFQDSWGFHSLQGIVTADKKQLFK